MSFADDPALTHAGRHTLQGSGQRARTLPSLGMKGKHLPARRRLSAPRGGSEESWEKTASGFTQKALEAIKTEALSAYCQGNHI